MPQSSVKVIGRENNSINSHIYCCAEVVSPHSILFPQFPPYPQLPTVGKSLLLPLSTRKTLLSLLSLRGLMASAQYNVSFRRFSNVPSFGSYIYTVFSFQL